MVIWGHPETARSCGPPWLSPLLPSSPASRIDVPVPHLLDEVKGRALAIFARQGLHFAGWQDNKHGDPLFRDYAACFAGAVTVKYSPLVNTVIRTSPGNT